MISESSNSDWCETLIDSRGENFSWDDVQMVKAMTAVEMGMSIRRASELHGVPRSTLHDRVSGVKLLVMLGNFNELLYNYNEALKCINPR